MNVFITGVRGFLGSALARRFTEKGHLVRGTSSKLPSTCAGRLSDISAQKWSLGEIPDPAFFAGIDRVIHCAHDFTRGANERNISGTKSAFETARSCGVLHQTFISSYSAAPFAPTEYAQIKFELGNFFLSNAAAVIKPGLVLGPGGLGGRILDLARRSWVLPIPSSALKFPYIGLDDFVESTEEIVTNCRTGEFTLWYHDFTSFPSLMEVVQEEIGRPFVVVPIPGKAVSLGVDVIEFLLNKLHRPSPLAAHSWRNLKANQLISQGDRQSRMPNSTCNLRTVISTALRQMKHQASFAR